MLSIRKFCSYHRSVNSKLLQIILDQLGSGYGINLNFYARLDGLRIYFENLWQYFVIILSSTPTVENLGFVVQNRFFAHPIRNYVYNNHPST